MTGTLDELTTISFAVAALAYAALTGFFVLGWKGRAAGLMFIVAAGGTALWAAVLALGSAGALVLPTALVDLVEISRPVLWLVLGYAVIRLLYDGTPTVVVPRDPLFLVIVAVVAVSVALVVARPALASGAVAADLRFAPHLALSVLGMVLVENLYQAARGGALWGVKHLIIALGALFAFDLFMYADALLLKRMSAPLQAVEPLVAVLLVPLLVVAAVRLRDFSINVHVSRRVAVHTAALISCGIYLLVAAAVGSLLRRFDLTWGPALQVAFLVGALVVLAVLLSSTQARTHGRRFIERNFFSFAYDYREEWLKLVRAMTEREERSSLFERAIKASAGVFDCAAGALFLRRAESGRFEPAAFWNWTRPQNLPVPPVAVLEAITPERPALELRQDQQLAASDDDERAIREWLCRFRDPWILIGLYARGRLLGFILIGQPMLSRRLGWEDHDLLSVLASQIGSYLAVEQMARQLAEAQRFEQVSKHFSFVAHDLKNLITQLSIIVEQARRHAGNPEFVQDALLTVGEAVDKMHLMLVRLRETPAAAAPPKPLEVSGLVRELVRRAEAAGSAMTFQADGEELVVEVGHEELRSVLQNVINNACEASSDAGIPVDVAIRRRQDAAVVEVSDGGPGMTPRFVEEELFSPFRSTKANGLGIGMYQCRQWLERWGGALEVESEVGQGTTVRAVLPLQGAPAQEHRQPLKMPA